MLVCVAPPGPVHLTLPLNVFLFLLRHNGHVQYQRQDSEAEWRKAGRVRVWDLPGKKTMFQVVYTCFLY